MTSKTTPTTTPEARRGAAALVLATAALAAALLSAHACVEEGPPTPDTWPTRDVLGLSPAWMEAVDPLERDALHERLVGAAVRQGASGASVAAAPSAEGEVSAPGAQLMDLDAAREASGEAPLLLVRVEEGEVLRASSCAAPRGLLVGEAASAPPAQAPRWVFDPAFDDAPLGEGVERDALERRLGLLGRLYAACAPPEGREALIRPVVEVVRADGAPALFALWPERGVIFLNPLLLGLLASDEAAPPPGFRTAEAGLTATEIDDCTTELSTLCEFCNTPEKVQQARIDNPQACSEQLFAEPGDIWDYCNALSFEIPSGFLRLCLNKSLASIGPNGLSAVRTCMAEQSDANGRDLLTVCDPVFVSNPDMLAMSYQGFIDSATNRLCLDTFIGCVPDTSAMQPTNTGGGGGGGEGCGEEGCDSENGYGCDDLCDEDAP